MVYKTFFQLKSKRSIHAFTLAEVLITILIIGIVATLLIPTTITYVQKKVTTTKIKKVFSSLSQTTYLATAEYGPVPKWEIISGKNRASAKAFAEKYMLPYLHVQKICDNNNTADCKFNNRYLLNGNKYSHDVTKNDKSFRFYMTDGTLISLTAYVNNSTTGHNKLVTMAFDINGQEKPNMLGKDVFTIEYMVETFKYPEINGKMIPQYGNRKRSELVSNKSNMCNKKQSGEACLALLYKDGWHMAYDYPW